MKAYYYYERDYRNVPFVTHCFVVDGETWARGTAVCSICDNTCKKTGRKIAYSRAMKAFYSQVDEYLKPHWFYHPWLKCSFMPEPNAIEKKFLNLK